MILESGTHTCPVNLGCVSLREAQREPRKRSAEGKRRAAIVTYHPHDEIDVLTDSLQK
jgi:hypothetical protein